MENFITGEELHKEMERARAFVKERRYEEALKSYMRVFEEGRQYSPFVGVRLSYCLIETAELGKVYKPAIDKLIELRDAHEKLMREGSYDPFSLQEWDALNEYTDPSHQIAFYDSIKGDRSNNESLLEGVRHIIWLKLIYLKRYKELSPEKLELKLNEIAMMAFMHLSPDSILNKMLPSTADKEDLKNHAEQTLLSSAGAAYECALGNDNQALAEKAFELVMKYLKTGKAYAALMTHAHRAGAKTKAQDLLAEAKATLPEDQMTAIVEVQKNLDL